jgi:hypothetical protein
MAMNFATDVTARQYYSVHGDFGEALPPGLYDHEPATGRPTSGVPDISGLGANEQATINAWVAAMDLGHIAALNPPGQNNDSSSLSGGAQTAITSYQTFFATAAYKAWRLANLLQRRAQWKWLNADAHDLASASVAPSSVASGTGSGAAPNNIPTSVS